MKWIRRILTGLLMIFVIAFLFIFLYLKNDAGNPYSHPKPADLTIPTFTEVEIEFSHQHDLEKHLPFMGGAIIDVDGDNTPEIWFGGGVGQQDGLYKFENSKFSNITTQWSLNKNPDGHSYGGSAFDIDHDGDEDLLVCRFDDVYLYLNEGIKFSDPQALNIPLNEKSVPISITLGDFDSDGLIDFFVSTYIAPSFVEGQTIFTDPSYGATSLLLKNIGNNKFEEVTRESGLSYVHNTFNAVFVDINNDGTLDLVVAHDTGEVRTYSNDGVGNFQLVENPLTNHFAYPMGLSVGDYNENGRPDFFFSNVGATMPRSILKGDLDAEQEKRFITDWILFENISEEGGAINFRNAATEAKIANFEFGWGSVFEDFNLDGLPDLVVAENYISLPNFKLVKLPGRFLLNTSSHQFFETGKESGVINKYYGISPLTADFNDDGYPDLAYTNLNGPARIWINNGGDSNYLKVKLEQSAKSLGARVSAYLSDGKVRTDWLISGEGLASDQAHTLIFGMNKEVSVDKVLVDYTNGDFVEILNPAMNQLLFVPNVLSDPGEEI